jgi:hypothetical protein
MAIVSIKMTCRPTVLSWLKSSPLPLPQLPSSSSKCRPCMVCYLALLRELS